MSSALLQPCEACDCSAARAELSKLQEAQFDTAFADAAYTDAAHRPATISGYNGEEYTAVTDPTELTKIGLTPDDLTISGTDFRAVVYRTVSAPAAYVVGFKGTTWYSLSDWGANITQALNLRTSDGKINSYYSRAQDIAKRMQESDANVRFVGHSLGGGLASAAAEAIGAGATTYNAAGLNPATVSDPEPGAQITSVSVRGEILTSAQRLSPLPDAISSHTIALDPPFNLARDLIPLLGAVAGPQGAAGGILVRSVLLHLMGSVHSSLDAAVLEASAKVLALCGG